MNPTFRNPSRTMALLLVIGVVLAWGPVAGARDAPQQTGPLNFDERQCGRDTLRQRVRGRMEVVARGETCLLFYTYDPLAEDNDERDYGIVWVQARIDPRGAWCATRVWSDLGVSQDTRIHKRIPARNLATKRPRQVLVKLASIANGFGQEKATLGESTKFHPRRLRHSRSTIGRSRIFTQRWTGLRGKVLNLTSGAEISWDDRDLPTIASGLRYDFERRGRC